MQTNGVFEMHIKKGSDELVYTIDLKKEGAAYEGKAKGKADVTINTADESKSSFPPMPAWTLFGSSGSVGRSEQRGGHSCRKTSEG